MIAHPGSPGAYALRLYQPGDDAALIDITRVAIREIGTARYSKDQVWMHGRLGMRHAVNLHSARRRRGLHLRGRAQCRSACCLRFAGSR